MPYTTIPTLSDGNILSASYLNLLGDNSNYLGSLGGLPNVAFQQWRTSSAGSMYYHIRHRHRYLKAYYETTGTCDFIKITYNGTLIKNDGTPDASETYSIDLNNTGIITPTPTVGQWYEIQVETAFDGAGELKFKLMWESSTA